MPIRAKNLPDMKQQISFVFKIAIASLVISVIVKYGGRILPLKGNDLTALMIVMLPSVVLGSLFALRTKDRDTNGLDSN